MLLSRTSGTQTKIKGRKGSLRSSLLLTSFAAVAVAIGACSAANEPSDDPQEGVDADGDAVLDHLGKSVDADGDGVVDLYDIDGDGETDGIGVDTDGDGLPDAIGIDTDGDGIIDALDTTGDGNPDVISGDGDGGDGDIVIGDGDTGMGPEGDFCDSFQLIFEPQTPTVYFLVDRSGSMGASQEGFWAPLRDALLPAVQTLQADVRFGFGTYTSTMKSQCDEPSSVLDDLGSISLNNYDAISAKYTGYADPTTGDTPTGTALIDVAEILEADKTTSGVPGDRFIVLVTDGNPDFCDNPNALCAQDATVSALQEVYSRGIRTMVFGLEATQTPLTSDVMTAFANAGAGESVNWGPGLPIPAQGGNTQVGNECGGSAQGTYTEAPGGASAFLSADPDELVTSLQATVAGLKSCAIEFNFDVVNAAQGEIYVDDQMTPIPQTDWKMREGSDNILELLGDSCVKWQDPNVDCFFAGFPCEAIVVR